MARQKIDRTGETFISNEGYDLIIIKYNGTHDLYVKILDEYGTIIHTGYENCKRGNVKNPYHKSVYGVGCLGIMKDGSKPPVQINGKTTKEYCTWHGMLQRCYDEKVHERNPSYKDATVCERWLCFANFLEDITSIPGYETYEQQQGKGIELDKDLLGNGQKIYSPKTVCFLPKSDNTKERYVRCGNPNDNSKKVYGVSVLTGEKTKVYDRIKDAQDDLKINGISAVIRGVQKTAGGYYWYELTGKE